jgi:hypothetical protein
MANSPPGRSIFVVCPILQIVLIRLMRFERDQSPLRAHSCRRRFDDFDGANGATDCRVAFRFFAIGDFVSVANTVPKFNGALSAR